MAYPGSLFRGGWVQQIQLRRERERGSGGRSPLVRGSGCSCNLVQESSFHIVKLLEPQCKTSPIYIVERHAENGTLRVV